MPWTYIGRVSPIAASTTDTDAALAVSTLRDSVAVGETLAGLLEHFTDPVFAVIDPNTGRVFATTDADDKAEFLAAVASPAYSIRLKPDTGQTGKSLTWSVDQDNSWPLRDETVDAFIDAVKPKRSVFALVNKLLTPQVGQPVFLVLDQSAGTVELRRFSDAATPSAALAAVEPVGAETVGLQITQPPDQFTEPEWPVP